MVDLEGDFTAMGLADVSGWHFLSWDFPWVSWRQPLGTLDCISCSVRQVFSAAWPVFSLIFQRFAPRRLLSSAVPSSFMWSFGAGSSMAPRRLSGKESSHNAGDVGLTPGLGRYPGKGNGNPLQNSCLGSPRDREAWWVTIHGVTKSRTTTQWLNNHHQSGPSWALYWEATVGVQNTQALSALRLWEQALGAGPPGAATLLYSHYPSLLLGLKLALTSLGLFQVGVRHPFPMCLFSLSDVKGELPPTPLREWERESQNNFPQVNFTTNSSPFSTICFFY